MAEGELRRKIEELYQAYCNTCEDVLSGWINYDEALEVFIDHRKRIHHSDSANSISP